jgi:hypothetical protein
MKHGVMALGNGRCPWTWINALINCIDKCSTITSYSSWCLVFQISNHSLT